MKASLILLSLIIATLSLPWGPYIAPVNGDQRPPCPALNVLANHGMIPRTGWISRDGLLNVIEEQFGMCRAFSEVIFQRSYTLPEARQTKFPFPSSWIFSLLALGELEAGNHIGSISRLDAIEGNNTVYDAGRMAATLALSTDGQVFTIADFAKARIAAEARSAALYNLSGVDPRITFLGFGEVALVWNAFGGQPIPLADFETFFSGRIPAGYTTPAPWCARETATFVYTAMNPTAPQPPPEIALYNLCKLFVGDTLGEKNVRSTICEDEFPDAIPSVHPMDWEDVTFPTAPLTDPFDELWALADKFPSDQADVNCSLNATQLQAARTQTLGRYYYALTAPTFDQLVALVTPLFVDSDQTAIHQAAAGDYYGLEDIIEYLSLVVPSLNNGYVWFSPSVVDLNSIRYYPQNATMYAKQTHNTTFDCSVLPDPTIQSEGICRSPVVPGIAGGMFTFESCGTKLTQYISNFDEYTNKGAVRASSAWDTCWRAMRYCTGPNQVFKGDFEKCYGFMNQIPIVACKNSILRGNSTVCRGLHSFLAEHRPDLHCEHITENSMPCRDEVCDGDLACHGDPDIPDGHYKWSPIQPADCPSSAASLSFGFGLLLACLLNLFI